MERQTWWISLTVLCAVLGALIGLSFKTQNRLRREGLPASNYPALGQEYKTLKKHSDGQETRIAELQHNLARVENSASSDSSQKRALLEDLNHARVTAGLTDMVGPGIIVTLNDSKRRIPSVPDGLPQAQESLMVHDTDIDRVVNELKAAHAEAISINGQRYIATTPIRCAGPTVFVNDVPQTPPYIIKVIGDPKTMQDALNLPSGVAETLRALDAAMIKTQPVKTLKIGAYAGPTQTHYAKPVLPNTRSKS